jgi:glutamate synthase (ferredoxin)
MFLVHQLRKFYDDLDDPLYKSAIALFTPASPPTPTPAGSGPTQPLILHNGEINTIRGNVDRMLAREETMHCPALREDLDKVFPVVSSQGSDSAMLDNTLEFLMMSAWNCVAVMISIPNLEHDGHRPQNATFISTTPP